MEVERRPNRNRDRNRNRESERERNESQVERYGHGQVENIEFMKTEKMLKGIDTVSSRLLFWSLQVNKLEPWHR